MISGPLMTKLARYEHDFLRARKLRLADMIQVWTGLLLRDSTMVSRHFFKDTLLADDVDGSARNRADD